MVEGQSEPVGRKTLQQPWNVVFALVVVLVVKVLVFALVALVAYLLFELTPLRAARQSMIATSGLATRGA
jgi:hypothetical protein